MFDDAPSLPRRDPGGGSRPFAGEQYTAKQLAGEIPKETVMASGLWANVS